MSANATWVGIGLAVVALIYSFFLTRGIMRRSPGNDTMQKLSKAVQDGAMAFLKTEYRILSIFVLVVAACLYFVTEFLNLVALAQELLKEPGRFHRAGGRSS